MSTIVEFRRGEGKGQLRGELWDGGPFLDESSDINTKKDLKVYLL